ADLPGRRLSMGGSPHRQGLTRGTRNGPPAVLVLAGPTASGKSTLALAVAERFDGTIINADSMQLYRELAVLTARPDAASLRPALGGAWGRQTGAGPRAGFLGGARRAKRPARGAACRSWSAAPASICGRS